MAIFTGAGVAIVTPFHEDGSIHYDRLDELIDFDIEAQELAEMTLAVPDEVAEKVDWTAV